MDRLRGAAVRVAAGLCAALAAGPATATVFETPAGQALTLYDVVVREEADTAWLLFRSPHIGPAGEGLAFVDVEPDFAWLCETVGLPRLEAGMWAVTRVVVALSDREVELGVMAPEATQFFESFTVDSGRCAWEPF